MPRAHTRTLSTRKYRGRAVATYRCPKCGEEWVAEVRTFYDETEWKEVRPGDRVVTPEPREGDADMLPGHCGVQPKLVGLSSLR